MANAVTTLFGAQDSAGDRRALFLKVFSGEVMTAFEEQNEMLGRHFMRSITSGKSAQFPATWKVDAAYHTPGVEIIGQNSNVNERVITIDDKLLADVAISDVDEAIAHYDVRSEYTKQMGAALKRVFNAHVMQVALSAARASATVAGGYGGTTLTNAAFKTDAGVLASGLFDAGVAFDEKDVPEDGRFAFISPAQRALIVQTKDAINKDWGGAGSYAEGSVTKINDIELVKSRNLPKTNITTGPAEYQGNFTTTAGLVMQSRAVGTVKLMDISSEMEWDIRRQVTLMLSKYLMGHGILRPECATEIKTA